MFCVPHCSIAVLVFATIIVLIPAIVSANEDCSKTDAPLLCHGNRVIRSVVDQVLDSGNSEESFRLAPGVEIVQLPVNKTSEVNDFGGRSSASGGSNGYLDRVFKYLQGHELKINLHDLLKNSDVHGALSRTFNDVDIEKEIVEGRKKDKGGLSMVLITALMMKKMLAVLGMGAVAAMAAKALGVALLALLLSALIGLKKLTESNQDESSHHVQYVTAHQEHHRLRRGIDDDLPLPYRGWTPEQSNI